VTSPAACDRPAVQRDSDLIAGIIHGICQPLTSLECGLELSLRYDKDAAQLRRRVKAALNSAQVLHQRVVELRMLLDAGNPGDTSVPVAIDALLQHLSDDLGPLAEAAQVRLSVRYEPAWVHGNADRLRGGFFHLFQFLISRSLPHHAVCASATTTTNGFLKLWFGIDARPSGLQSEPRQAKYKDDLSLRIAGWTFQSGGGDLVLQRIRSRRVDGHVLLHLAKQ